MIDERRLEQEYRRLQKDAAPDLWERIEGRLKEHPERGCGAGLEIAERQGSGAKQGSPARQENTIRQESVWRRFKHRYAYGVTAAAAAIAITVGLNAARNSGNMSFETTAGAMEATMAAATEAMMAETAAAATEAMMAETAAAATEVMMAETTAAWADAQDGSAAASGTMPELGKPGGMASALAEGVVTWQQLSISEYTALSVPERAVTVPEDTWYFSEDILADTGLLCGAEVGNVSFEYDSSGNAVNVVYDLTIKEIYYAEDYVSYAEQIQVKSPVVTSDGDEAFLLYQLQTDSTYLLPLKKQEGVWNLLYPFAPQVQVLKEGGYLFHSGYASLMDSKTSVVIGQQEAANDYYYDRMLFRNDDSFLSEFLTLVEH